ncbi:MAG: hypothetical protein E7328_05475 [Clostridiales bacterium]|nr:hypothetical protein [Clostridiales bacterium]
MKKRFLCFVLAVFTILLLTACSNALIGQWRSTEPDGLVFSFESGGKFTMHSRAQQEWNLSGTYENHGNTLKLTMEDSVVELTYRIQEDVLTIEGGQFNETLNRVKNVTP